ncbi:MAG TPA: alpha-E domain-containing protein, partial [Acidimicrobiia bacterium]|nr:alpha-E domain-containing protein [Acidimicrobiia bacterium]
MNQGDAMLLSRVAESVYWAGRYLERAEATARLVHVHTELFLDLPKAAGIGWTPLLALTGSGETFRDRHHELSEEQVVDFLATGAEHEGAIVASIARAHSNLRVTQAILPIEAWEVLNELHLWADQTRHHAVDRRTRLAWTNHLIRQCQLFSGLLAGTMSHDDAYAFLEIGRGLERADMTTRILDVQAGILLGQRDGATAYADLTWMGVLRSLSAHQMFRRTVGSSVSGPAALRFLLRDQQLPRSVERCLIEISRALLELSRHHQPMAACAAIQQLLEL